MSDEYEHKLEAKSEYISDASSVSTPDIDSVPDFKNMIITKEEALDLCKINNSDNEQLSKCIQEINQNNDIK